MEKEKVITREKVYINNEDIVGKTYNIVQYKLHKKYYTRINHVYITDYVDEKGHFLYRKIDKIPAEIVYNGEIVNVIKKK